MKTKFTYCEVRMAEIMRDIGYSKFAEWVAKHSSLAVMLSIHEQHYKDGSAIVGVARMEEAQ